jgi:hypothetical protein
MCVNIDGVWIGECLYTRLVTTRNYNATPKVHNTQITTAPATFFPARCVFTSRSLATVFNNGDASASVEGQPKFQRNMSPPSSRSKNTVRNQCEAGSACYEKMTFNRLHGVISQKMELFITTVVRTSDPTITDYKKQ